MQTSAQLDPKVIATFEEAGAVLKPPPKLTVSEWAEANRVLSSETSSYRGSYRCALAPYQRGMMDAVHIPGVGEVIFWTGAQLGKSTVEENIGGYFFDQDPCPVIWMWPTLQVAQAWSNDTLEPFLRDTPVLAKKFAIGSRKSSNRTLVKRFPGGILSIIGANSAAELRRRRARVLIGDEVDAFPFSVGEDEGNPIDIVAERSVTFWNAIRILASTGTIKNNSAIEAAYAVSNRQKYFVPCLHCGDMQLIKWNDIQAPRDQEPTMENTFWICPGCHGAHSEVDKLKILQAGEWIAERPEIIERQGFWLPSYYSPFEPWYKQVKKWREINRDKSNNEALKTFTQLKLAETWEERAIVIDRDGLLVRCEKEWPGNVWQVPAGVCVITAGVDVQENRLEVEVVGWGRDYESWSLDVKIFEGDVQKPDVWQKLDEFLQGHYVHQKGVVLPIAATFVDCGFNQGEVMAFTKSRWRRRVWASKGMSNFSAVPLGKKNQNNKHRVWMYPVGVSSIKKTTYERLTIDDPGPGYMHFSVAHNDATYFDQLTCEKLKPKNINGRVAYEWVKPEGRRNEALDRRVYADAAMRSLWDDPKKGLDREYARILEEAKRLREAGKLNPDQMSLLDAHSDPDEPEDPAFHVEHAQASEEAAPADVDSGDGAGVELQEEVVAPVSEQANLPAVLKSMRRKLTITKRW